MKRKLLESLIQWKNKSNRKPLIIEGARQVGKTYLLQEFGRDYYKNTVYVNFDRLDPETVELFSGSIEPQRIIEFLAIKFSTNITPGETLIIFDEVQEVPRALSSLKYFLEDAPDYHIVAAGSLLGVALHPGTSFPVGKVDFLRLEPLSFEEFCWAIGLDKAMDFTMKDINKNKGAFSEEFSDALQKYMIIGGMPEAVVTWLKTTDIQQVDSILANILGAYRNDFSKYTDALNAERINRVWQSIPSQFARESRKFIYGVVREGARAREYEVAISWLEDAGLVRKVSMVNCGDQIPLSAYADSQIFKLYLLDIGLLRVLSGLSAGDMLPIDNLFDHMNGLFTEQFVLQQICEYNPYYWSSGATSEVDYVLQYSGKIIPIEVKSGNNVKAKSLKVYRQKYDPVVAIRFSMRNLEYNNGLINIPLYYSWCFNEIIKQSIT